MQIREQILELTPGSNVVRFLSHPYQYLAHPDFKLKEPEVLNQPVRCPSSFHEKQDCQICSKESICTPRWAAHVLNRKDNDVYFLDFGHKVFRSIQKLAQDSEWGNPESYDVNINLDWDLVGIKLIPTVIPYPKKQLTLDELEIKKFLSKSLLDNICHIPDEAYKAKITHGEYEKNTFNYVR